MITESQFNRICTLINRELKKIKPSIAEIVYTKAIEDIRSDILSQLAKIRFYEARFTPITIATIATFYVEKSFYNGKILSKKAKVGEYYLNFNMEDKFNDSSCWTFNFYLTQ